MNFLKYVYGLLTGTLVGLEEYFTEERERYFNRSLKYAAISVSELFDMQDTSEGIPMSKALSIFDNVRKLLTDRLASELRDVDAISDEYMVVPLAHPMVVYEHGTTRSVFTMVERRSRYGYGVNIEVTPIVRIREYELNFNSDKVYGALPNVTVGYRVFDKHTKTAIEVRCLVRYGIDGTYHVDKPETFHINS